MCGMVTNSKRLISITDGNLRHNHLYISGYHDFFPDECYGESTAAKGTGRKITLIVEGLRQTVETDIARSNSNGRPRNFFRKRAWVKEFLKYHGLRQGDVVTIEQLDRFTYRVYPSKGRSIGRQAPETTTHERAEVHQQAALFPHIVTSTDRKNRSGFGDSASAKNRGEPLHRWVPWIAGFSAAFVDKVFQSCIPGDPTMVTVLDPFAGVGTTLVEGLMRGYTVLGFEINPYAALACELKLSSVRHRAKLLSEVVSKLEDLSNTGLGRTLTPKSRPPSGFRSRIRFFSPAIEHDVLLIQDFIYEQQNPFVRKALKVALGAVMVSFSNYSYEPSLSTRSAAGKPHIDHADVFGIFCDKVREIEADIRLLQRHMRRFERRPEATVYQCSYLHHARVVSPASVDIVITSPPYLNNYHYVRNTRPQLYWLGLAPGNAQLKKLEQENFGQFWQTVRTGPPIGLLFELPELSHVVDTIRKRNPEKGVYGGAGWANYVATYFNDCYKFFEVTRRVMKPGGLVVVVIGNNIIQGVHVQTERFLGQIAEMHGFSLQQMHRVREKRTGSSIVNSSVRAGLTKKPTPLYETAVEFRTPR